MEHPSILRGKRVLLVDDDTETLELLAALLAQCGCEVKTAISVETALPALEHTSFDLLVGDIALPGVDGYELIQQVRRLSEATGRIPALALTATGSVSRIAALNAGYDSHICKPADPAELFTVLAGLLVGAERARGKRGGGHGT